MSTLPNQSLTAEPQPGVEEILDKFQKLGEEAAEEDANEDDADAAEDGGDGEDGDEQAEGGEGSGDKKRKKKKKKKGKASKAVEKLKFVSLVFPSFCSIISDGTLCRTIATGQAPQEVIDAVRGKMDSSDSKAATDGKPCHPSPPRLGLPRHHPIFEADKKFGCRGDSTCFESGGFDEDS